MKISDAKVKCPACGWKGIVDDCEPDVDGDGSPGCPICLCNVIMEEATVNTPQGATHDYR